MKQFIMDMYFGGKTMSVKSDVEMDSAWKSLEKAVVGCLATWLLGAFMLIVPFINWTLPGVFLFFGPVMACVVFVMDRKVVNHLDADAVCPHCKLAFHIHEDHFASPMYGQCPSCKTGYEGFVKEYHEKKFIET